MTSKEQATFDNLLKAAEATMQLWIFHGLGDDENESGPVWDMLQTAILEGRKLKGDENDG